MKFWIKIFFILAATTLGIFLIYLASSVFFTPPSREITFEEFEPYKEEEKTGSQTTSTASVNYSAPDFELPNLIGEKINLNDFKDKIVILVFWTTWNPAAQDQIAILESYYQEISAQDEINLITINSQEDKSAVASFINRGEYQLPVLLDEGGLVGELYSINILPAFYFINKDKMVKDRYVGALNKEEIKEKAMKLYTN